MLKWDRWKTLWSVALFSVFGGAVVLVFTGDEAGSSTATAAEHGEAVPEGAEGTGHSERVAPEPVIEKTVAGCLADSSTLEDLRRQKTEIEAHKKELVSKEAELKAREQVLNEEMKKLAEAREEIAQIDGAHKKENEGKIAKLVETVEGMNPKAAAGLVAALDEGLAVATMTRLSTLKLSKLMNVMDPTRSTKLSELMAGVVRAKRGSSRSMSDDIAVTTSNPGKRGDKNDGKNHEQQASNRSAPEGDPSATRREPASGQHQGN